MVKNIAIAVLAVAVVALGGFLLANQTPPLRGSSGPTQTQQQVFLAGTINGGPLVAITTSTNPLTAANVCDNAVLTVNMATTNVTLQFPSSTALFGGCLSTVGNSKSLVIQNVTSSSGFTLNTATDGSSTLILGIVSSSINNVGTSTVAAGQFASVTALRSTSSSQAWLYWFVSVFR